MRSNFKMHCKNERSFYVQKRIKLRRQWREHKTKADRLETLLQDCDEKIRKIDQEINKCGG